jgi:cysteine desulfurase
MRSWYLDYAAATPVDPRVLRAMRPYFSRAFGNPGSLHRAGAEALSAIDHARETIARVAGVGFRDVIFTASATEANNLALRGVVRAYALGDQNNFSPAEKFSFPSARRAANSGDQAGAPAGYPRGANTRPPLPRVVISAVEHDSVLETARDMERAGEIELVVLPVDRRGIIDLKKLERALDERTVLVSVMYVNNEIGTVQPLAEISNLIRRFRDGQNSAKAKPNFPVNWVSTPYPLFHSDAAQALLYYPCNVKELGVDLMTLSSQKAYGPKGAGALVLGASKNGMEKDTSLTPNAYGLTPILTGGGQEFGIRAGTENVPAIIGFAAAAAFAEKERAKNVTHAARVRDIFVRDLIKAVSGVEENVSAEAPHIANMAFPRGTSSEDLLVLFDREHIAASPGAACSARALTLSHVLRAIGIPDERIKRSIRFSFGRGVTLAGAEGAAQKIVGISRYILEKKS